MAAAAAPEARTLPGGLLADARNYLDITWEDPEGDAKLSGILLRGMGRLDQIAGAALDYGEGAQARALLFDYARYVRADALAAFETDYVGELLALHLRAEVERYAT